MYDDLYGRYNKYDYFVPVTMQGSKESRFGTASRTVTLDLSVWARLYECAEIAEIDFKTAITRAIAVYHAQTKQSEAMSSIPQAEKS